MRNYGILCSFVSGANPNFQRNPKEFNGSFEEDVGSLGILLYFFATMVFLQTPEKPEDPEEDVGSLGIPL